MKGNNKGADFEIILKEESLTCFKSWHHQPIETLNICACKDNSTHLKTFMLLTTLGRQTGSRGIHQQIAQRAQLLSTTLSCAFPQGVEISSVLFTA